LTAGEVVQLFEDSKHSKTEKLFEFIDALKENYANEVTSLQLQIENLEGKLSTVKAGTSFVSYGRQTGFRSSSNDHEEGKKTTKLTDDRKNNSSAAIAYRMTAQPAKSQFLDQDLLETLHQVVGSVDKYRELCPPASLEARMVHKNLMADLENAFAQARIFINQISSEQKVGTAGDKLEAKDRQAIFFGRTEVKEAPPAESVSNGLVKSLQELNRKLERKCEDRKVSLKKLYCIVLEKDKQLKEACAALEKFKVGSHHFMKLIDAGGQEMQTKLDGLDSKLSLISNVTKGIFEGFPFIPTDGSLEYSMTRRYDAFHRSILSGNKNDDGLRDRRSYESRLNIQIEEPPIQEAADPFSEVDEPIRDILQLARERFSYSEDEDPSSNLVTVVKIVKDWAFLVDQYNEEVMAKERALEEKSKMLNSLNEREKVHASVVRDMSSLKEDCARQLKTLKDKLDNSQNEIGALTLENERLVREAQLTERRLKEETTPTLMDRPPSRDKGLNRTGRSSQKDSPESTSRPELDRLRNENEKLKDKLSILTEGLEDKLQQVSCIKKEISGARTWVDETKLEMEKIQTITREQLKSSKLQLKTFVASFKAKENSRLDKEARLQTQIIDFEGQVRNLNGQIEALNKNVQEQKDTFDLSLSAAAREVHNKAKELGETTTRMLTMEEELDKLRRQVTSMEESSLVGRAANDNSQGLFLESSSPQRVLSLPADSTNLVKEVEDLRAKLADQNQLVDDLEAELHQVYSLNGEAERQLIEANLRIEGLESEAEEARGDTERFEGLYNELLGANKLLEVGKQDLESQNGLLHDQNSELVTKLTRINDELKRVKEASSQPNPLQPLNKALEGQIKELQTVADSKDQTIGSLTATIEGERRQHDSEMGELKARHEVALNSLAAECKSLTLLLVQAEEDLKSTLNIFEEVKTSHDEMVEICDIDRSAGEGTQRGSR
jgi:predicted  nucleic acid-binding Zn-ribbon protein